MPCPHVVSHTTSRCHVLMPRAIPFPDSKSHTTSYAMSARHVSYQCPDAMSRCHVLMPCPFLCRPALSSCRIPIPCPYAMLHAMLRCSPWSTSSLRQAHRHPLFLLHRAAQLHFPPLSYHLILSERLSRLRVAG